MPLVYYLTAAGQEALTTPVTEDENFPLEVNFPQEYRRLLGMIEVGGHVDVIRGRLRRFPDELIDEWLKELEDLKMVESREAGDLDEITFTGARLPLQPPLTRRGSQAPGEDHGHRRLRPWCAPDAFSPTSASPTCRRSPSRRPRPSSCWWRTTPTRWRSPSCG